MRNDKIDPEHVEWSRQHFTRMAEGGAWGVPRSGLLFVKHGDVLELTARMPYVPNMPITQQQLELQQDADYKLIKTNFEAAGIAVIDISNPT
jgi:hypothetical protein